MLVIGLHKSPLAGITYLKESDVYRLTHGKLAVNIADSIVVSGSYEDDLDDGETLVYTGIKQSIVLVIVCQRAYNHIKLRVAKSL